jgi:hypothetical protein
VSGARGRGEVAALLLCTQCVLVQGVDTHCPHGIRMVLHRKEETRPYSTLSRSASGRLYCRPTLPALLLLTRYRADLAAPCRTFPVAFHLGGTAIDTPAQAVLLRQHFRAIFRSEQLTRSHKYNRDDDEQHKKQDFFTVHDVSLP